MPLRFLLSVQTFAMSLSFCILGSGSGGNSTLLSMSAPNGSRHALIDCGLSPRETNRRLQSIGLSIDQISDIFITHLDGDHFAPSWVKCASRHSITLHIHRRQQLRAGLLGVNFRHVEVFDDDIALAETTRIESVPFAHDDLGTVGYVIEHGGLRLGFATDLGRVPPNLYERFVNLHALALESNYDGAMQLASNRPLFLKRRIMNGSGHLSNDEAFEAVSRIAEQSPLSHIALLHLSRQCNCPTLLTRLYADRAPGLLPRLVLSDQFRPTPIMQVNVQRKPIRRAMSQAAAQT